MKQDKAIPSIGVQYVPYGINGEYFIYDNNDNCIPIGYGHIKGTKKFIQGKCDELNRLPSIGVKDELDITKGEWVVLSEDFGRARIGVKISDTAERNICNTFQLGYGVSEPDNAKAICTAVNETYGKGYDPAAMEELYKALEKIVELPQTIGHAYQMQDIAKAALTNAKTIKK